MDEAQYHRYLELGIPVIAYSSQAGGVFSCGYKADLSDAAGKHKKYVTPENIMRYQQGDDIQSSPNASEEIPSNGWSIEESV